MLTKSLKNGAGKRTVYLTVEQATDAEPNAAGEVLPEFNRLCERWAEVAVSNGREFIAAMQTVPMLQALLKLPYDSKTALITTRDRIKIGSRTLNLASIFNENEANEKIVLWCVEVD